MTNRKIGDKFFLTHSGDIVKMEYVTKVDNLYKICGFSLLNKSPFFIKPLNSTKLSIFKSDGIFDTEICMYSSSSIKAKMICLESENDFVFIPILHTLELLK